MLEFLWELWFWYTTYKHIGLKIIFPGTWKTDFGVNNGPIFAPKVLSVAYCLFDSTSMPNVFYVYFFMNL